MPAAIVAAKDRERFARARARGDARAQDPSAIVGARYDFEAIRVCIEPLNGDHSHVLDTACAHSIAAIGLP